MYTFPKQNVAKSIMYLVTYSDGRTAYLWVDGDNKTASDHRINLIAKEQQERGLIPSGSIARIRRVH